MANWNMVWLQQRANTDLTPRGSSGIPLNVLEKSVEEPTTEQHKQVEKLQRHTASSKAKVNNLWMKRYEMPTYLDKNDYKWDKMKLHKDCMNVEWNQLGGVRKGTKIGFTTQRS